MYLRGHVGPALDRKIKFANELRLLNLHCDNTVVLNVIILVPNRNHEAPMLLVDDKPVRGLPHYLLCFLSLDPVQVLLLGSFFVTYLSGRLIPPVMCCSNFMGPLTMSIQ